jgi:hypothetical protein
MTNSLVTIAAAVAGLVVVAVSAPGFAKSNKHAGEKHAGYAAPLPVIVVRPTTAPEFAAVGPNGCWVTTTWGCWVDDGQGRFMTAKAAIRAAPRATPARSRRDDLQTASPCRPRCWPVLTSQTPAPKLLASLSPPRAKTQPRASSRGEHVDGVHEYFDNLFSNQVSQCKCPTML